MKWLTKSKLGKAVLILGILAAAIGILAGNAHLRSRNAVEEYQGKLRAAGEKLTIAELDPPRVSPEQNGVDLFRPVILALYGGLDVTNLPNPMRMIAPGKAMIAWQQPTVRDDQGTNSWDQADLALAPYGAVLDALHQVESRPVLDFQLDYEKGFDLLLPHLSPVKASSRFLSVTVVCDLHRGDTERAMTNAQAMLALVRSWKEERLLFSQLTRIAMAGFAFRSHWELLQSPTLADAQLAQLQRGWTELDFARPMEDSLGMERAIRQITISRLRTSNSPALPYGSSGASSGGWWEGIEEFSKSAVNGTKRKSAQTLWRISWSYTDELQSLQGGQVMIDTVRQSQTNGFFKDALREQDRKLKLLGIGRHTGRLERLWQELDVEGLREILSSSVMLQAFVPKRLMRVEAERQLIITAIALKRYRLRHGNYPPALEALVPEFLPVLPRDPVDGLPLRYRPDPDGTFLLYSIGEDGTDDGGDPNPVKSSGTIFWERGRDWVWPRPATAKEIEEYEKETSSRRH